MVKTAIKKTKTWIKQNKKEFIILLIILLLASFFRLYRIDEYLTFLGDEGRDAIIVRRFLVHGDIFLIGPGTSIGNMYLGPLYYYMMAPPLLLAAFSPVGPAVQIALLGILTVFLIWYISREWFGPVAACVASFLYAISPTVIIYSKSSWNPNIMPFFALICVYGMWRVVRKDRLIWLPIVGVSFAFVLQSHYLGLLLLPTLLSMWAFAFWLHVKSRKKIITHSLIALILFALLMSPLLIFDSRHGWINFEAMKVFFTQRQTTVSARPWNALPDLWPLMTEITTRLLGGRNEMVGAWVAALTSGGLIWVFWKQKQKLNTYKLIAFSTLIIWLAFALIGLGLYKQEIYDHYYGFFFPAPFMLVGAVLGFFTSKSKIRGWWILITALVFLSYFSLIDNPIKYPPNRQLQRSVEVAEKISFESKGDSFNIAVIAERNYEDAYQYFLEKWGDKVVDIDAQRADETITDQLFVVCELPEEKCDPTHNPKTEVANFGWSRIEEKWELSGVILYKLVHN